MYSKYMVTNTNNTINNNTVTNTENAEDTDNESVSESDTDNESVSEAFNSTDELHENWIFVYDYRSRSLKYPLGYYLNTFTNQKYDFRSGIRHIVGEKNEDSVYSMWWVNNK